MSNLYSLFCKRLVHFLCLVCLASTAAPVLAAVCNGSPVFAFSQALYLEQYDSAQTLLPRIERERGAEMAQFLHQVLRFKRAYETDNDADQKAALDEIDRLIKQLSEQRSEQDEFKNSLSLANILIHTARMQLAAGNVLRAAKLAKQGKRRLDDTLSQRPENVDALLANGLYYYYTGSENEALGWLMRWWSLQGDKVRGRTLIEEAVERSADHSFEAARSLVSDVAWNRRDSCRYLPLFDELGLLESHSITALQEHTALLLFCGLADQALIQITALEALSEDAANRFLDMRQNWLFEARLYALAALGDVERLNLALSLLDSAKQPLRYQQAQFSLAKGLDTLGAHDKASTLYHRVAASRIGVRYRLLAKAYMQRPYQKTRPYAQKSGNRLQFACGNK